MKVVIKPRNPHTSLCSLEFHVPSAAVSVSAVDARGVLGRRDKSDLVGPVPRVHFSGRRRITTHNPLVAALWIIEHLVLRRKD